MDDICCEIRKAHVRKRSSFLTMPEPDCPISPRQVFDRTGIPRLFRHCDQIAYGGGRAEKSAEPANAIIKGSFAYY